MNTTEKIKALQKQIRKVKKELEELEKQIKNLDNSSSDDNVKSTKYKITLSEFWNSEKELAIGCNTEEKANRLLKAFDRLGKMWSSGNSYLEYNCYTGYGESTYYTNTGMYCDKNIARDRTCHIYEFEDVDLEN